MSHAQLSPAGTLRSCSKQPTACRAGSTSLLWLPCCCDDIQSWDHQPIMIVITALAWASIQGPIPNVVVEFCTGGWDALVLGVTFCLRSHWQRVPGYYCIYHTRFLYCYQSPVPDLSQAKIPFIEKGLAGSQSFIIFGLSCCSFEEHISKQILNTEILFHVFMDSFFGLYCIRFTLTNNKGGGCWRHISYGMLWQKLACRLNHHKCSWMLKLFTCFSTDHFEWMRWWQICLFIFSNPPATLASNLACAKCWTIQELVDFWNSYVMTISLQPKWYCTGVLMYYR